MHIAVLATTRNPLREPFAGGQEAQTASLTAGLRARGHTVRLYAQPGTDPGLADELATYAQVPTIRTPEDEPLAGLWRDDAAMSWAMADLVRRPVDLVHNQSLHHFPLAMSRAMPSTMVTTLHCPPYPLAEIGVSLAADDAVYVGVSEAVASMWRLLPIEPLVIHNGVRSGLFEFGSGGEELVWVGRITPEKGADLAIRAARTAGLPLTIVGPIADAAFYRDHVEPLLGDGVRHAGHLDQRAIARIVGSSLAILVTPRWDEPFGMVAAEAMMSGTPVIAIGRGGLREVVSERSGVLVGEAGTPTADLVAGLADAVSRVRELDRADVRADAIARFDEQRMVEQYCALFESLAARR